ncbi:MAG: aminopeptidase [Desulfovibrionaceae bacterium]|nr:aminopeptidase [Desulfovibrionaceae bacterium]
MSENFLYEPKSAWSQYAGAEQKKERGLFVEGYRKFLGECKTERETICFVETRLREAGFSDDPAGNLFVRPFRGKALFAARRGTLPLSEGLSLIAAHADSPRLDLKQRPFFEQGELLLGKTHYYGGIRKYQWFARPLALHGVLVKENSTRVEVCIGEDVNDPVFCVADLLPHLASKQEELILKDAFDGERLAIVSGHEPGPEADEKEETKAAKQALKKAVFAMIQSYFSCEIREEDFITADLELVPAGPARYVGFDRSLIGGYGQDDRICVYTALDALLSSEHLGRTKAVIFWDKEEIGSDGATGASSRFLSYAIEDLVCATDKNLSPHHVLLNTQALSADVTAGIDPDCEDLHDKHNAARMGYGPCFSKFTGSRGKYGASEADAEFFGEIRDCMNRNKVPWQACELGRVGMGGGGTVALFLASWGMQVIDLGPALLGMHSPFELSSCADIHATRNAYRAFLAL